MSRMDELKKKAEGVRSLSEIPGRDPQDQRDHRPRSGQGSFAVRQKMEDRVKELEALLASGGGSGAQTIQVSVISPNPWQPRRVFDEAEIEKLAHSIAEVGLIQPVVVRSVRNPDTSEAAQNGVRNPDTKFELVAGERRLRAHKRLEKGSIEAVVIDVSDAEMAALALAENVDRTDLTAYEIAVAIRNAETAFPNKTRLAESLGIARTELYQYLSFFKLPNFIIDDLEANPGALGRDAAEDIVSAIKKGGTKAEDALKKLWPRVLSKEIDQGKLVALVDAAVLYRAPVNTGREIQKLFHGSAQAGSITRDAAGLAIKIRAAALTPEKEIELKAFVERLIGSD